MGQKNDGTKTGSDQEGEVGQRKGEVGQKTDSGQKRWWDKRKVETRRGEVGQKRKVDTRSLGEAGQQQKRLRPGGVKWDKNKKGSGQQMLCPPSPSPPTPQKRFRSTDAMPPTPHPPARI